MSLHLHACIVTPFGTAANNRGETEGNNTTLQKLLWHGGVHTSVSAEAIRFALRGLIGDRDDAGNNRTWDDDLRAHAWKDADFKSFAKPTKKLPHGYADDDVLGFMSAQAAKEENGAGTITARRGRLEVTRAVSLDPWSGDYVFNAAAPGATPSANRGKGTNPVPYGAEVHATAYQYGFALTPESLADPRRALHVLSAFADLHRVAGNHGRFLYDFAPASVILRITEDPAPRILYGFRTRADQPEAAELRPDLIARVGKDATADLPGSELIVGGLVADQSEVQALKKAGVSLHPHAVKAAFAQAIERVGKHLQLAKANS